MRKRVLSAKGERKKTGAWPVSVWCMSPREVYVTI